MPEMMFLWDTAQLGHKDDGSYHEGGRIPDEIRLTGSDQGSGLPVVGIVVGGLWETALGRSAGWT